MYELPSGTVTFLFTDIQGSTKLWEAHPEQMRIALARHDALMYEAIRANNGHVFYEESETIFRELGDKAGSAMVNGNLGSVAFDEGDLETARSRWEACRVLFLEMGDRQGIAYIGGNLGNVAKDLKDYATARTLHEASLVILRELGICEGSPTRFRVFP